MARRSVKFLGVIALLFLISCGPHIFYESEIQFKERSWNMNDVKQFSSSDPLPTEGADLILVLRHNQDYPYRNIYFFIESQSEEKLRDTLVYPLGSLDGRWFGRQQGAIVTHHLALDSKWSAQLEDGISVQHGMRDEDLPGIESVALMLRQTE